MSDQDIFKMASNQGYEMQYIPPNGYAPNNIRLVQAIVSHRFFFGFGSIFSPADASVPHIDTSPAFMEKNQATQGGIRPPAYTDVGPVGDHGPLSYFDSPGSALGLWGSSAIEVAAVYDNGGRDQILGCVTFGFDSNRQPYVPGGAAAQDGAITIDARVPGLLWNQAITRWQNQAGR